MFLTTAAGFIILSIIWAYLLYNISIGSGATSVLATVAVTAGLGCAVLGPFFVSTPWASWVAMVSGGAFGFVHFSMSGKLPTMLRGRLTMSLGKTLSLVGAITSLFLAGKMLTGS